jgi:ATP-binding cassette, subfamily B, bacterial PglK
MIDVLRRVAILLDAKERRGALALLGLMLVGAFLEVAGVAAIPAFVALLSSPERILRYRAVQAGFAAVSAQTPEQRVIWAALALALLYIIKNSFLAWFSYVQAQYVFGRQVGMAKRLFDNYLRSPYTFHLQRNTAQLLHTINNDVVVLVNDVIVSILRIAIEVMVLIAVMGLLIVVEPLVSVVMMGLLGGTSVVFLRRVRRKLSRYAAEEQQHRSQMIQWVNQGLGGLKEVKVLRREAYFLGAFSESADIYTRAGAFRAAIYELPRLFLETVAVLTMLGVAALFIWEHRAMQAIVPTMTLLALAAARLMPSANRLVGAFIAVRWGRPALNAVYDDYVRATGFSVAPAKLEPAKRLARSIELRDVSYCYPGAHRQTLSAVNLVIPKGKAVAFVGPSGAGKTTAVDVLLGLLEPTSGQVLVDGRDIREDLAAWQRQIGYIPQQIYLSDDSIRRNVAFGIPDDKIDDNRVWAALESAQLHDFIRSLPEGLDASVGERGVRLSGGQRQRIGIARALYHDPSVLVMDEATSALDHRTESLVMETIERLRVGRTIIAIAHRQTTVERFDTLAVVDGGSIVVKEREADVLPATA